MNDQSIITHRIEEVKAENARLHEKLDENGAELADLETAANVIARLTGAKRNKTVVVELAAPEKKASAKQDGIPTMPKLIVMALKHEKRPMTPREITDVIRRNWWPDADGQKIGSVVWRLNKRDDIEKVEGTSTYRLPQKNEPPGEKLLGNTSGGSLFTIQAKGREAVPGGGP